MSAEEASAGDKPNFAGKYVLVRNENFDDFLAANGMTLHYCCLLLDGSNKHLHAIIRPASPTVCKLRPMQYVVIWNLTLILTLTLNP